METDDYGRVARFYDRLLEPVNAPLRGIGLKMHPVGPGDAVLDVGCGTGAHLETYVDSGATCFGIDASPAMLEEASKRLGGRATLELGDATALPHADGTFDLVFTSLFLHELDADIRATAIAEMARVMKADGGILVIDYASGSLTTKGRITRAVSTVAERIAGRYHYRNWRTFLGTGGIPSSVSAVGLAIDQEKVVAGGNLALWLLRRTSDI